MSRNTKIILVVVGTLICSCTLLCMAGYIALPQLGKSFVGQAQDPENIQRIASEIADFDLPPGYQNLMGFDLLGTKMVMYSSNSDVTTILALFQVPGKNVDQAQMEQQMQQQLGRSNNSCTNNQVVGQETLNVKGTPTLFVISECSQRGVRMRQVVGAFPGKNGLAIALGMGPTSRWDQNAFRRFAESIR